MTKVTLKKYDESYLQVLSDDRGVFHELEDAFKFEVPGAKFNPKVKMKVWDGFIRLFSVHTQKIYFGLHDKVLKKLEELGYEVDSDIKDSQANITPEEVIEFVKSLNLHSRGKPIEVRDYQLHAIYSALKYKRKTLLSPTGSGKSLIIYCILRYLLKQETKGKKLIVVPNTTLVVQLAKDFIDYSSHNGFKVSENLHSISSGIDKTNNAPIFLSTWQSIFRLNSSWFNQFDAVMVDECHQAKATSLTGIMEKCTKVPYRIGLTGSLDNSKTNTMVIEGLFGSVLRVASTKSLMEEGHLAKINLKCILLNYSKSSGAMVKHLDYQKEIDFITSHEKRNKFICNLAATLKGNTLILFTLVDKHGAVLHEMLKKKVDPNRVHYIHGGVDKDDRDAVREVIENSTDSITLASSGTFSTGTNVRKLNNIIFAAPTKSIIRVLQSLGRGLRLADGKTHINVYDLADVIYKTKTKQNHTFKHLVERLKIYTAEEFEYKLVEVKLENE